MWRHALTFRNKNLSKAFFKLLSLECNNNIGYNFSTLVPLSNLNIDFVTHLQIHAMFSGHIGGHFEFRILFFCTKNFF